MYNVNVEVKDEILGGNPQYDIKDANGNILFANCSIEMVTEILQQGTPLNKEYFARIQGIIDYINNKNRGEAFINYYLNGEIDDLKYSKIEKDV